jgi:DNA-binding CsgD family transcriptional regulator
VAVAVGRGRSAAMLGGAATALREAAGVPLSAHEASAEDEETAAVRKLLAADELAAAWAGGRSLSEAEILREVASVGAAADAVGAGMGRPGQAPTRRLATAPDLGLTPREQEVLAHLVAGRTDKEIAAALGLAATTASKHVSAILGKFGVKSRGAAVAAANRVGLM